MTQPRSSLPPTPTDRATPLATWDRSRQPLWYVLIAAPAAWVFRALGRARAALFAAGLIKPRRLPGRVISIGNIVAGGTGKTPLVVWLAQRLQDLGHRPAILSRGYGSGLASDDGLALLDGRLLMPPRTPSRWPDEARMQSVMLHGVPVVCGARRFEVAERFLREGAPSLPGGAPSHWLLDDGFQHRRLARDADVVLLDARRPFGNGSFLPLGTLREGQSALARARLIVFTRADATHPDAALRRMIARAAPTAVVAACRFRTGTPRPAPHSHESPALPPPDATVLLATAIAGPAGPLAALEGLGYRPRTLIGDDHARFDEASLREAADGVSAVFTTEKDYWRSPELFERLSRPTFLIPLTVEFEDDEVQRILAALDL